MAIFTKDDDKKKMTVDDIKAKISEWSEVFEVFQDEDDLKSLHRILHYPILKEKLVLSEIDKSFTYILKEPIKANDNTVKYSSINIKDCDMEKKRTFNKLEDVTDKGAAMFQAYCNTDGEDLPIGFISRINSGDQLVINSIITGFFIGAI